MTWNSGQSRRRRVEEKRTWYVHCVLRIAHTTRSRCLGYYHQNISRPPPLLCMCICIYISYCLLVNWRLVLRPKRLFWLVYDGIERQFSLKSIRRTLCVYVSFLETTEKWNRDYDSSKGVGEKVPFHRGPEQWWAITWNKICEWVSVSCSAPHQKR